jgi:hypothetical protein
VGDEGSHWPYSESSALRASVCSVRMFRYFVHMHFECPAHFIIIDCIALTIFILKHRLRMLDTLKN